jgi:acetate kinase
MRRGCTDRRGAPASGRQLMPDAILSLNAGSSSLKFALCDSAELTRMVVGSIETADGTNRFRARDAAGNDLADEAWPTSHQEVIDRLLGWVDRHLGTSKIAAAGHRIVHGGRDHYVPEMVTPDLITTLEQLAPLAPLHQLHSLAPMRAIAASRSGLPQVACFDTAFHRGMPSVAKRFALPREYDVEGIRRYGFHGLSYEYIAGKLAELAPGIAKRKVIVAHLGNGASLCAMEDGHSVDTSMGMTPLDGLVMGTRSGAIDPGVILYLVRDRGMTAQAVEDLLYRRSGLLGVSGVSSDMRTLLQSADPRAAEAVDLFVFRIVREIAALAATLQGLDALVFTAGIGEHAPEIRRRVCEKLTWIGIKLNAKANEKDNLRITVPDSRVVGFVIPTNEELVIARHTRELLFTNRSHA